MCRHSYPTFKLSVLFLGRDETPFVPGILSVVTGSIVQNVIVGVAWWHLLGNFFYYIFTCTHPTLNMF